MKKSQVLAALALAFALGLGVVAPVANTYAAVEAPANQEQADKLNEDLAKAVEEAQGIAGYDGYSALIQAVDKATENISDAKKTAATTLYGQLTGTAVTVGLVDAKGEEVPTSESDSTQKEGPITIKLTTVTESMKDNYDALMQAAVNYQQKLTEKVQGYANLKAEDYDKKNQTELDAIAKNRNDLTAIKQIVDSNVFSKVTGYAAKAATDATALQNGLQGVLSKADYDAFLASDAWKKAGTDDNKKINALIPAAKATKQYGYFSTLTTAVTEANKIATTGSYSIAQGQAALNKLNAAIKGTSIDGPNKTTTIAKANVTVTADFGDDNVVLNVKETDKKVAAFGDRKTAMYDITLTKDGKAYKFDGSAVVTIDFKDAKIDASKAGLYYVKEDGTADFMKGAKFEGTTVTFTTSHFSVYAIVEDAAAGLPNTGVISAAVEGNASTTVAMVAGIATALTAAGAGVVAYRNARRSVRK